MAKRVFQVAKELGIKSKEIVTRCHDEGVPGIENHMSTVSAGLDATIHDWFSNQVAETTDNEVTAPSATAVAAPVRKKAARKKATKKKVVKKPITKNKITQAKTKLDTADGTQDTSVETGDKQQKLKEEKVVEVSEKVDTTVAVLEPVDSDVETSTAKPDQVTTPDDLTHKAETEDIAKESDADTRSTKAKPKVVTTSISDTDIYIKPDADDIAGTIAPTSKSAGDTGIDSRSAAASLQSDTQKPGLSRSPHTVPNIPERPNDIIPAGPQLDIRKPAKLSGPKIVRVEKAEEIQKPRSRSRSDSQPSTGGRGAITSGAGTGPGQGGGAGTSDGPIREVGAAGSSRRNVRRKSRGSKVEGRSAPSGKTEEPNHNWRAQDLLERQQRLRGAHGYIKMIRRESKKREQGQGPRAKSAKEIGGIVKISEPFSIKDLSAATGVKASEIITALFKKGIATTINSGIDTELAMEIMIEYGIELTVVEMQTAEDLVADTFKKRESVNVQPRAAVITILGHVDHGKTSLLDKIRKTNVAQGEAGGITQHTSAFRVNVRAGEEDKNIVFLDTPGHEAFTEMRARGAKVTDIVVLVIAADDGIMPQTVESINHAKAAHVPIIIALNKIDKPEATEENLNRIYAELSEYDLSPVQWGGSTELVKCSALKGEGIQDLLDAIDFQAQLLEFTADKGGPAGGYVLEAKMVEGRGAVASILVREGTLKIGDFIVMGRAYGRVRDMTNELGKRMTESGPSTPLEISGMSTLPDAGDAFYVVDSLKVAEEAAEHRLSFERERALAAPKITLDNIFNQMSESERKTLNLIVKADAQGSVETLKKSLEEMSTDELTIRVIHAAVGGVMESDIILAEASQAIILGFHIIATAKARELAERKHCEIRIYQVIYELLDDVRKAASGLLDPEFREEVLGHTEVRQVFRITKVGMIAGCYTTDGTIERNAKVRVTRDGIVIENNRVLEQLKRFKEDVKVVRSGQECGMKIEGYDDIKPGDILECYKIVEIPREL